LIRFISPFRAKTGNGRLETLPKVYRNYFGVLAGGGVQNLKMFRSRSRVRVYSTEAGVESESNISDSVHHLHKVRKKRVS